ncbi:NUDIX domain-containing protein [Streptomyces sp. S1A]|uniref:NUDIX domain-containing protein n=1 Tax=Streptomyces sp. ICN903 TaxID=2964654 RepID=UPI001EDA775F|nr:NUDIX domain-containing protein [Streptomyces sp. ICN903]MCG3038985.1 NUDIX domain-containing protein [Streptomyces sp. ICN903]
MTIKHPTASVFPFALVDGRWRLGMIEHPRLGWWMVPGGHVEAGETPDQGALRELVEESGFTGRLLPAPGPELPAGYPHPAVAAPWWTVEIPAARDNHHGEPHVHIEHLYVAVVDAPGVPVGEAVHPFRWTAEEELAELHAPEDTKIVGKELFGRIGELARLTS